MDWKDLGKKIGAAGLTVLGTAIAGPAGASLGAMLGQEIFGSDSKEEGTPEKLASVLGNPETIMKMKEFELNHKVEIQKLALQGISLGLGDKSSARGREVEITKATGKRDANLYALAWLGVAGYIGILIYLISCGLPKMTAEIALMVGNLIGIVGAKFSTIYDYFFGAGKEYVSTETSGK